MNMETAKRNIGKLVMSRDAGNKLIRSTNKLHGPYKLLKITKSGFAMLAKRELVRIPVSLLTIYEPN